MSNVIGFLERMGRDAGLRDAARNNVSLALDDAGLDPELREAILGKDQARIVALLGGNSNVCCILAPEKREDDEEQEPSKEDEEISARAAGGVR